MNDNIKNTQNHTLRSRSNKIYIENVELEYEVTDEVEDMIVSKLSQVSKLENNIRSTGQQINNLSSKLTNSSEGHEEAAKGVEEAYAAMKGFKSELTSCYIEIISELFINGSDQQALDLCKDSKGRYNLTTLSELTTITLDWITTKVNNDMKAAVNKYKKSNMH